MCGIVSWSGKTPMKFNKAKFDLVGSYNEERGEDSCGVASDGYITVGVQNNKVYRNFIVNLGYDNPSIIPTVIGHTRKATFGQHNSDNAHPFGFGVLEKTGSYEFIGVHNGSLLNHIELAEKYKIDIKVSNTIKGVTTTREKIDSEVLLEIIYKQKNFKVLSEYLGAAALVFSDLNKPNVVYCWHGASKKTINDKEDDMYEERPLFYYKETRNSLYISSMENSLQAIGGEVVKDENKKYIGSIGQFKHNVLYKITDGNIATAELIKINRRGCYHVKSYENKYFNQNSKKGKSYQMNGRLDEWEDFYDDCGNDCDLPYVKQQQSLPLLEASNKPNKDINTSSSEQYYDIYNEKLSSNLDKNKVYFNKLRYWKDSKLITGCYVWINNFGFYFLADNIKSAEIHFNALKNKEFYDGQFVFVEQIFTKEDGAFVPFFELEGINKIEKPPLFYFFEGIRLSTYSDYLACIIRKKTEKPFSWESLSICSTHPIIDINNKLHTPTTQYILKDNKIYNDIFSPLGSNKTYTIENGNCVFFSENIKQREVKEMNSVEKIGDILLKHEESIRNSENVSSVVHNRKKDSDLLNKVIEEIYKPLFEKIPLEIQRLELYGNYEKGQEAMLILEDFLKNCKNLLAIEEIE
jgi:hypothetical protein